MLSWAGGLAAGLVGGVGLVLVVAAWPAGKVPTLDERLAPYLRDAAPSRLLSVTARSSPLGTVGQLLAPLATGVLGRLHREVGGVSPVQRRLDLLGPGHTVDQLRGEQLLWAAAGAGCGVLVAVVGARGRAVDPVAAMAVLVVGGLLGALGREQLLSAQVRRREERMLAELPTVAELLALSVAAGEGAHAALERVARTCQGDLAGELERTLAEVRAGAALVQALEALAARTRLPSLARFVDGVVVAIQRGTPLAEVLRAQAQDVRELSRRRLIEVGGRKELLMMVPVVFLILPVTVLFAVYPGLAVLDLNL